MLRSGRLNGFTSSKCMLLIGFDLMEPPVPLSLFNSILNDSIYEYQTFFSLYNETKCLVSGFIKAKLW